MNITVSSYLRKIQSSLFPGFAEELGPTTEKHQKVIVILDVLKIEFDPPKKARYKGRTEAERVNSNLKDDYGARYVRVRGASKVMCHLMFGVLALTAFRLLTLTI